MAARHVVTYDISLSRIHLLDFRILLCCGDKL